MGSRIIATCGCGVNEEILIGGGMHNFTTTCLFPCSCAGCSNVVQVDLLSEKKKCPQCQSKDIIPYDDPGMINKAGERLVTSWNMEDQLGRVLEITNGSYWCPVCKNPGLRFEDSGLCWD